MKPMTRNNTTGGERLKLAGSKALARKLTLT
jgi:hypothetical protein